MCDYHTVQVIASFWKYRCISMTYIASISLYIYTCLSEALRRSVMAFQGRSILGPRVGRLNWIQKKPFKISSLKRCILHMARIMLDKIIHWIFQ